MRKFIAFLFITSLLVFPVTVFATEYYWTSQEDSSGEPYWYIDSDGTLTANSSTTASLSLGDEKKDGWGSIVSPMTDASGYVYSTDSGGVLRLYDAGYINLGAGTAVDTYILFDTDDDDFYMGRDDTDNDFAIGVGSTLGTDERISITDDATSTIVVIGDGVNAEDKQITIDGNALDFYIGYDDSEDDLVFGVDATVGTKPCFSIQNEATPLLYLHNGIDGFGAVDIDYGSADVTDHTFVSDGGTLILDGTITLTSADIISNATDDTIRVASEDADTVLEIYTAFDTTGDATLKLSSDLGDAAGEQWTITSTGATTDLVFGCDDSVSGTPITRFTISDAGVVTTVAAVNNVIDDASNSTVTDVVNITHSTSGTAEAGHGLGLTFDIENGAGTIEEHASFDVVATTSTNGSEDTDIVVNLMTGGALAEVLRVKAANSGTTGDMLVLTSNTTETNAVTDILSFANVTGTAAANTGLGITWDFEDAGGAEQQASLDVVLVDETDATEDADFIFSQQVAGAVVETVRFVAGGGVLLSGTLPKITIGDAGAEDTAVVFDGNAQDFYVGLDDTADDLVIGVGSALGTTAAISIDENTDVSVSGNLTTEGALDIGTVQTFTDSDLTPDVSDGSYFITNTTGATLTDFDGAGIVAGQIIYVESAGAITYDVTGQGLIGGTTDIVTADGDLTVWLYNGTDWILISFMDLSDDYS